MIGDEIASTSDQSSSSIGMPSRRKSHSNQNKKSESSISSPNMSPSFLQNKQYRTNAPRSNDLIESMFASFKYLLT